MTQFHTLTPKQAIEVVAAAGVEDPARLIRDHAAAGLVKSYAHMQVTIAADGQRTTVRDGAVSANLWERMVQQGVDGDAWSGGTVRLAGSDLIGGTPAVHVTGIAFNPAHVHRLADQQRPASHPSRKRTRVEVPSRGDAVAKHDAEIAPEAANKRKAPDLSALHSGALHLTVEQTKAALSIGHATLYKLLNAGDLERAPSKAGTRITADSVRRYAGVAASA